MKMKIVKGNIFDDFSRQKQNPFDRPRPKPINVNQANLNANKRVQMQKVENFRDQLNKQLFGDSEIFGGNQGEDEAEATKEASKKDYKVPPKVYKRPEGNTDSGKENKEVNNIFGGNTQSASLINAVNPLSTQNSAKNLVDIFSKNDKLGNDNKSTSRPGEENSKYHHQHAASEINTNQNISFSEDNCNSVVCSENKHDNPSESSNEKKLSPRSDSNHNTNTDVLNSSTQGNEANMQKIEKSTKFTKIPSDKVSNEGSKVIKPIIITSPLNSTKNKKDNLSIHSFRSIGDKDSKSVRSHKSTSGKNDEGVYNSSRKEEINKESLTPSSDEIQTTNAELNKQVDQLKSEIKELKQIKSTVDSNYQIELNKNKLYEKEIEELRKSLNQVKMKEISQGEEMLKLEIQNLKNKLEFRIKENDLLAKENRSMLKDNTKLQNYLKEIIVNKQIENRFDKFESEKENENEKEVIVTKEKKEVNAIKEMNSPKKYEIITEEKKKEETIKDNLMDVKDIINNDEKLNRDNLIPNIIVEEKPSMKETIVDQNKISEDLEENHTQSPKQKHVKFTELKNENVIEQPKINIKDAVKKEPPVKTNKIIPGSKVIEKEPEQPTKISSNLFADEEETANEIFAYKITTPKHAKNIAPEIKPSLQLKKPSTPKVEQSKPNIKLPSKTIKNTSEKNLFDDLTSDIDDIFSSNTKPDYAQNKITLNKVNPSKSLLTPPSSHTNQSVNQSKISHNTSFNQKEIPTVNDKQSKFNMFSFDMHNEEDIGDIFGSLTKNKQSAGTTKGNSLFD